ncbi:MAG: hypothetical protein J1E38_03120 [Paramuribaculum sp.]|nr:hypothetical protein [Paramuribaculum sp.]
MKKIVFILFAILIAGSACTIEAQSKTRKTTKRTSVTAKPGDPYKGEFRGTSKDGSSTYANFNLHEATKDTDWTGEEAVYGYIENTTPPPRAIDTYYIVGFDSLDSPEPNIWVKQWPEDEAIRVGLGVENNGNTIIFYPWDGNDVFYNNKLKRVK